MTHSPQEPSVVTAAGHDRAGDYPLAVQTTPVSTNSSGLPSHSLMVPDIQSTPASVVGPADTHYSSLGFMQGWRPADNDHPSSAAMHLARSAPISGEEHEDPDDPWDIDMDSARYQPTQDYPPLYGPSNPGSVFQVSGPIREGESLDGVLVPRHVPFTNSPLLEERSQRIFRHYMTVTALCMATFERHEYLGSGPPRVVWTHGLPTMAFNCPALAHAILAVGAMHMFKLNIGNESIAIKHFMCALRRVGRALSNPKQRLEVTTLATVLLLGYYEVLSGDHSRWNLHLSGARKLVMEHDYAGMMRTIRRTRSQARFSIAQSWRQSLPYTDQVSENVAINSAKLLDDNDWKVDQVLISKFTGFEIDYDTQAQPQFPLNSVSPELDSNSLASWRVLTELYWWYCRQDIFTSLLSGDPLLLPYAQWKFCPPRGPFDNSDKMNSTFDHLWLILARLADFGGKDRKRKQHLVNTKGGQWIPPPGFLAGSPSHPSTRSGETSAQSYTPDESKRRPNANEGRTRTSKPSGPPGPQLSFYGMMPPATGPVEMLPSYNAMSAELKGAQNPSPTSTDSAEDHDLETQTRYALEEHAAITQAFDLFESQLSPDYQPVGSSHIQIITPFGPALQYKSHSVATLWTYFTMGRILLRRMHPHSPPAAMVSAGVNARVTHDDAQTIGRICGGLFAQHNYLLQAGHVDYILSGAVMEVTFPLLFAAVQYQDHVQRGWTVGKLNEISQVIGWHTSAAIAVACESMWEKAGSMGRGPPYQRTMDRNNADHRLNRAYRVAQDNSPIVSKMSPMEEHESRFVSHDRKLIDTHASTRAHWAMGLLAVEEDLQRMVLKEPE